VRVVEDNSVVVEDTVVVLGFDVKKSVSVVEASTSDVVSVVVAVVNKIRAH
jgi:hypothetical protein